MSSVLNDKPFGEDSIPQDEDGVKTNGNLFLRRKDFFRPTRRIFGLLKKIFHPAG